MFWGKVGAESDAYVLRFEASSNELQTVWNVEIVDLEFGQFVRTWNEEFKTVKWEEVDYANETSRVQSRGATDCAERGSK